MGWQQLLGAESKPGGREDGPGTERETHSWLPACVSTSLSHSCGSISGDHPPSLGKGFFVIIIPTTKFIQQN